MNKSKMLHRYLGQLLVHLLGGWRHFLSMTLRLVILVSIFMLVLPNSVFADNATLTPNSFSYDTSDSSPIPTTAVDTDDTTYDAYVVPDTYDESIYQHFNFTFPSTTEPITSFELVYIYYGKKVSAKIELVIDGVVKAEIDLPDAGNGEEVISQIDLLQWHEITTADLSTLEIRFLAEKKPGNGQTAETDFVKLYVGWGTQIPTAPPGNATGSVTVDGRLKLSEEPYSHYKRITHPQTPGDLYFYHDTTGGMCYYLLEVDRDFNDNVFSDSRTYLIEDGWNKGHGFGDLEESDNAYFNISDSGSTLYDFYLGYLGDDGSNWISGLGDVEGSVATDACAAIDLATTLTSTTSLEWDLENTIYASNNSMDTPPGSDTWDSPPLDYNNYTNGLGDYWEFRMIYELGFPDDCGCGDADVADAHNSPSKHEQFDAPLASIGDYVWHDEDEEGLQDTGEYGLEGITVHLYKETAPGSDTYELIRTSETDSRGWYEFSYLDGGDYGTGINYYVDVAEGSLPTGYSQTQITTQNRSNPPPDGDRFIVNLEPGDAYREADFGYADRSSIGDYVWIDDDGDGKQGSEFDVGINGVELELWEDIDASGNISVTTDVLITTTITANNPITTTELGWYLFEGLSAGDYIVRIAPAEFDSGGTLWDYGPTEPNQGTDDTVDSDGDNPTCPYSPTIRTGECGQPEFENNILATTTLSNGQDDLTIDFGVVAQSPPTAVTLSSFAARPSIDDSRRWLLIGLAGVTVLAAGSLFWTKRRAG